MRVCVHQPPFSARILALLQQPAALHGPRRLLSTFSFASRGLQGLLPSIVMVVNPTIQYVLFEWVNARILQLKSVRLKKRLRRKQAPGVSAAVDAAAAPAVLLLKLTAAEVFLSSAIAKMGATLATYPMQVIKNRLQVSSTVLHTFQLS